METIDLRKPYVLQDQIGFLLRQANQRHVAIFNTRIGEKLTTTQWAALAKLKEMQPCSQNLLGRETAMDVATIKGVVDRLVKRGLVTTVKDEIDARRLVLTLTDEGTDTFDQFVGVASEITAETMSPLTQSEQGRLLKLLQKIC